MTFTVTYRAKDGAKREETVEAANRAACVAECRRRGVVPTGIREGRGGKGTASPNGARSPSVPLTRRAAVLGVVILTVVGGVWWWLMVQEDTRTPVEKPTKTKVVKPVQNQPVARPAEPPKEEPPKEEPRKIVPKGTPMSERKPPKTYRDERGILRYEGGARAPDPSRPHHVAKRMADSINDSVFKTRPENEIAMLLTATPGDTILTIRRYDETFEAEFMKSLEQNIEVTEDDTPARAELKRAMAETKKELAERIKKGEKLADILEETRSELRRLADYRRNLEKMVSEAARNPELADQEVADYLTAANKMLADNGMKPIKSSIVRKNLMIRARNHQKETTK